MQVEWVKLLPQTTATSPMDQGMSATMPKVCRVRQREVLLCDQIRRQCRQALPMADTTTTTSMGSDSSSSYEAHCPTIQTPKLAPTQPNQATSTPSEPTSTSSSNESLSSPFSDNFHLEAVQIPQMKHLLHPQRVHMKFPRLAKNQPYA